MPPYRWASPWPTRRQRIAGGGAAWPPSSARAAASGLCAAGRAPRASERAYADKGIYYLGGLTEATETLACFVLMCLWPQHFGWWAYGFALLCALTIATRLLAGWRLLRG